MFSNLNLIKPVFKNYRSRLFLGIVALIGVDFCQLFIPRLIKKAIDGLESTSITIDQLQVIAIYIVLLAIGVAVFRFMWRYLILGFSRFLERDIRQKIFTHLLSLDQNFFHKKTTGELMALSTNDLSAIQLACGMGLVSFLDAIFMSIAVVLFMIYINPLLTLLALAPLPILAFVTKILSRKLHIRFGKVQEQFSELTELARSTISSLRLIKVYTREKDLIEKFNKLGESYIDINVKVAAIKGTLFPLSSLIGNASLLLVVSVGGKMTINNTISIGDFVAFISYLFMMTWPMMAFGWVTNLFQRGITSISRVESLLEESPLFKENIHSINLESNIRKISVSNLSYSYQQSSMTILKGINLTINPGITGIIGRTGSGKSTLCHLLARLYPVRDHSIHINDKDINSISINDYRSHIAYVPQEPLLFSDTIAFNISFGTQDADKQKIIEVARKACIHDEICSFEKGYNARIGEKGLMLSGGQRQRISLARAFLSDAEVIIIDDGLSAVDAKTEQHILRSLQEYSNNKIIILVSHRLTTLINAQLIAVFDNGKIVDQGNHQHLSMNNEYYRTISQNQSENNNLE